MFCIEAQEWKYLEVLLHGVKSLISPTRVGLSTTSGCATLRTKRTTTTEKNFVTDSNMTAVRGDILLWFLHLIVYSLLTLSFGLGLHKLLARQRKNAVIDLIPGFKAWPILGNSPDFAVDPREFFRRCMGYIYTSGEFHSPVVRFWAGRMTPVVDLYKSTAQLRSH
ncbi:hypothetical protein SK128_012560 [Halocaridina rubra]|uniref:Uncharacterized protein n=1 Tax=Halocaridina rubra TaxID=373956 RepID=A0AAN8X5I1_HALRR